MNGDAGERFGDVLRRRRLAAGLSQEELAERAGLSVRGISDLERGARKTPRRATVRLLARALGLAPADAWALEAGVRPVVAVRADEGHAVAARGAALPLPLTSLIGRERELAELSALLWQGRPLVTLTGPGGVGKTRLALEVARRLEASQAQTEAAALPHDVALVELAPLADAALVLPAGAAALGIRERTGLPLRETLIEALRARSLLLVLDNCEHVVDAAAALTGGLLKACAGVRVLATSREPLGVPGETVFRVPPLTVPPEGGSAAPELDAYPATRLFLERAALRGAAPDGLPAHAVAQICRRLDGLPLAIELAAARVGALGAEALATRLDERFRVLAGGSRTAPPRQQTLRATVDWSYQLLAEPERALLRRLGVFAGGFTLEAAEAVANGDLDVLSLLPQLVDKSLVVAESDGTGGDTRYHLLETLRAYARDRLTESGEEAAVAARHAAFYLPLDPSLVDEMRRRCLRGLPPGGAAGLPRHGLARELDNLRAALRWCLDYGAAERGLVHALGPLFAVWSLGGHFAEARRWVDAFLAAGAAGAAGADVPVWLRAAAHGAAGLYAQMMGDYAESRVRLEASIVLSREAGGTPTQALSDLDQLRWLDGDDASAAKAIREGLARAEATGDAEVISRALRHLSFVAYTRGDLPQARALVERSVAVARAHYPRFAGQYLRGLAILGRFAYLEGNRDEACVRLREALAEMLEQHTLGLVPETLEWLAQLVSEAGDPHAAARLLGAAGAARLAADVRRFPNQEPEFQRDAARIRDRLTPAAFDASWAEGERMDLQEAAAYALDVSEKRPR